MGRHKFYEAIWTIKYIHEGNVLWKKVNRNALVDEGEKLLLNTFFRNDDVPTSFYVGLCYGALNEESRLIHIPNEPVGNGYARQQLSRSTVSFPILEKHEGDYRITTKTLSITASGGAIGPINTAFMATVASGSVGNLISYLNVPTTFTIQDGDTITFVIKIKAM